MNGVFNIDQRYFSIIEKRFNEKKKIAAKRPYINE